MFNAHSRKNVRMKRVRMKRVMGGYVEGVPYRFLSNDVTLDAAFFSQKFTGHSTEVFKLLAVPQSPVNSDNSQTQCSYFLSAAINDRVVNAW
jgi:hypothetical protein